MNWLVKAIITGITSFAATNIDDVVILMLFFAQVDATFRRRHIVLGQYLGFTAIVLASLPGFFGGLIVPKAWIGILGLLPILIGISRLVNRENDEEVQAVSSEFKHSRSNTSMVSRLASFLSPQTYNVAAVTLANGGDNIGIYVPLFGSNNLASLAVILGVFFLLIGVWCYIAYLLTRQPVVARVLTRYGKAIVPFVLIGLGIFILIESGTYRLLPQFQ
ncbi:cadmium resistance transporter [Argonema galeatum]|uniref:cadmium resistance transporter n=1 Tax=Argonema galeatum TaxID=2942762 RepID=UPI002010C886|nr:cadmium resistance transporter [Argonema galeatum]MCL1466945.1 cadmium resistance transporter [Argonema galeatum A003/A1]